ncbi:hypothetical protein CAEBREN_25329 [Caenorhabditis brenneri]|uniref:Uncharacterized protein n=1 Tax=Caenorhabditis brenneri TaxID=135651 RepID=G0PMR4_CAEBE|nr:hypothetical protein CAEBREN_25329 [Caenorhabditis brenneri]
MIIFSNKYIKKQHCNCIVSERIGGDLVDLPTEEFDIDHHHIFQDIPHKVFQLE